MENHSGSGLKKTWNKMMVAIMLMVACMLLVPLQVAAGDVTSGTLGDNGGITWTYDESTKTLTVTGEDSGMQGAYNAIAIPYSQFYYICRDVEKIVLRDCTIIGNAEFLFCKLSSLKVIEFENFDTSQVTNMSGMFMDCANLEELDVSGFDTSRVTSMRTMFSGCSAISKLDVGNFDTSQVTDMAGMFNGCSSVSKLDVGGFDTSQVKRMESMFYNCSSVNKLDISGFNTSRVTNMRWMFGLCSGVKKLDVSGFITDKVEYMEGMFYGCSYINEINLSSFVIDSCTTEQMLEGCDCLDTIYTPQSMGAYDVIDLPDFFFIEEGYITLKINRICCNKILILKGVFADVPKNEWYYPYVLESYNSGYMSGTGKDVYGRVIFKPLANVTREQFVQILYNIEGTPAVQYQDVFPDVPQQSGSAWYSNAIMWAVQNNIVSGYNNGMFGVGDNITREQVAVILLKYADYKGYDTSNRADLEELRETYLDVDDIHSWAADSMCWAVKNGVMKGTAGGKLMPLGNASRAEAATMLLNMLSAYGE